MVEQVKFFVTTFSTIANAKLFQQLNEALKSQLTGININQKHNYLAYLIYQSFPGANRLFNLSFEDNAVRTEE